MAKVTPPRKRRREQRETNWLLIGGVVAVGVIGLFALLFLTLQGQGVPTPTPAPQVTEALETFCAENSENCVDMGQEDAPVTVVEVSDYGCIHCRNFNLETAPDFYQRYVDTGDVHWIVLPFALRPETQPASAAALCAAEQDAFFDFHHAMFEMQDSPQALTREGFVSAAEDLGLDVGEFEACLDSGRYDDIVQRNVLAASGAGVSATPTFFVNGVMVEGNAPDLLQQQIEGDLGSS